MNILFYVSCTPDPLNGGIERVSHILALQFAKYGHNCYCLYYSELDSNYKSDIYKKTFYIPYTDVDLCSKIKSILLDNKINIVLNQLAYIWPINNAFYKIKKELSFVLFSVYHNNPIENKYILADRFSRVNNGKDLIRFLLYKIAPTLLQMRINRLQHNQLERDIQNNDGYVYLSSSFKDAVIRQYKVTSSSKLIAIPNPLTYNHFFDIDNYDSKEKKILIVGRYDELQKRLSRALKIWKKIESKGYNDWKLILVGHGKDQVLYENMIRELNIKNVELHGKSNPMIYYNQASIFLMTSTYEGWPMTLLEAMQLGCVPIVYNTFSSIYDIIDEDNNGYIIQDNDEMEFVRKLLFLMNDKDKRIDMAKCAIEKSRKFESSIVAQTWINLFAESCNRE